MSGGTMEDADREADLARAGVEAAVLAALPERAREELLRYPENGCVGQSLVVENERARVWMIQLPRGGRLPFHKHVKDYVWLALSTGRARSYVITAEGVRLDEFDLRAGAASHAWYAPGAFKIHDLENIGGTELIFSVTEFAEGANPFLPIPDSVKKAASNGMSASWRIG